MNKVERFNTQTLLVKSIDSEHTHTHTHISLMSCYHSVHKIATMSQNSLYGVYGMVLYFITVPSIDVI